MADIPEARNHLMLRMRRLLPVLLAAVLLAAACGSDDPPEAAPTGEALVAGVIPIADVAPLYLANDQGLFAAAGITVEPQIAQGGAAIVPAVIAGDFAFGFSNVFSLVQAAEAGLEVRIIAPGSQVGIADYTGVATMNDDITEPGDLAGRTIAINTLGNIGEVTVRAALADAGVDPEGVTFIELGFGEMTAAMAEGRIDAAWQSEPFLTQGRDAGARQLLSTYLATDPDFEVAQWFTSQSMIDENPDAVDAFRTAILEANRIADEDNEDVVALLPTYTGIDADTASKIVLPKWDKELDVASVERSAQLLVTYGLLDEVPDIDAMLALGETEDPDAGVEGF